MEQNQDPFIYKEQGIQCESLSGIPDAGEEINGRMCGAEWKNDSRVGFCGWEVTIGHANIRSMLTVCWGNHRN